MPCIWWLHHGAGAGAGGVDEVSHPDVAVERVGLSKGWPVWRVSLKLRYLAERGQGCTGAQAASRRRGRSRQTSWPGGMGVRPRNFTKDWWGRRFRLPTLDRPLVGRRKRLPHLRVARSGWLFDPVPPCMACADQGQAGRPVPLMRRSEWRSALPACRWRAAGRWPKAAVTMRLAAAPGRHWAGPGYDSAGPPNRSSDWPT